MINFKFVWAQFKKIRILLVLFFIFLIVLSLPALLIDNFDWTSVEVIHRLPDGSVGVVGTMPKIGGVFYLKWSYFSFPGIILMSVMSLIVIYVLVSREVDKGYMASWLALPMSRRTILNSKLFLLLTSFFSLYFLAFIFQLIVFSIRFQDFEVQVFALLVIGNVVFLVLALLWTSINWFLITSFNKEIISFVFALLVLIFFLLFHILVFVSETDGNLQYLKNFKYLTIISLFDFPANKSKEFFIKAYAYSWQIPLMLIATASLFYLGNYYFIKKDLSL